MADELYAIPSDAGLLTCTQMGGGGTKYKVAIYQMTMGSVDQIINVTADGDQRNRWAGRGHKYIDTDVTIRGWMIGGSEELFGFLNLGEDTDGYSGAIIQPQTVQTHTLTGYLRVYAFNANFTQRAQTVPIAFRAKFDGIVEANPSV